MPPRLTSAALVVTAAVSFAAVGPAAQSRTGTRAGDTLDWPTFGFDVSRSGSSTAATGITAGNVGSMQRQQVQIDGIVDASAIYLHGVTVGGASHDVFFLTNTYGRTMAIDANDGRVLWQFTPAGYDALVGTRQITNSTPTADPDRQFIYAGSPDGRVEKLAIADGHAVWGTSITKLPTREKIASPLGLFRGHVIAVTGGYIGDAPPYQGHVAVLDAASGQLLHVWNSLCSDQHELLEPSSCNDTQSAIWGRAGAVIDPATGNIFVATGNGPWNGRTAWGDAVLELAPDATEMIGNYTPSNTEDLNRRDLDVGSTSPALLGGGYLAQGGKDGTIRLLSEQMMRGTTPHRGGELQVVSTPSGARLFTAPAVMHSGSTTWMFAADGGATAAWTFSNGKLTTGWHNSIGGTSPVVAGGLLFIYNPDGGLHVYDPTSGREIATLECGPGHWSSPIVADGRILLPEGNANHRGESSVIDIWRVSGTARATARQ